MASNRYILRSTPRKEDALARHVESLGVEVFSRRIPVQRVNPRARSTVPYFPEYALVHVDLGGIGSATVAWTSLAHGLVAFGSEPVPRGVKACCGGRSAGAAHCTPTMAEETGDGGAFAVGARSGCRSGGACLLPTGIGK